ncbi:MAG: DUF58 domain-containing protein [Bacillota bacterium]|nr:DUF58 domain-containing protein [Bacillota bacterium]
MKKFKKSSLILISVSVLTLNAIISGGEFQYFLLFALLVSLLSNYIFVLLNKKNLSHLFFSSVNEGIVGENIIIEYKLSNNGIIPIMNAEVTTYISKRLGETKYLAKRIFLKSYQFINLQHEIALEHRGYYCLGKVQVDLKDPLNLFSKRIVFDREIDLTIYPRVHHIEKFITPYREMYGNNNVNIRVFEDFTNIRSPRPYVPGDSFKKIHWKLTAKNEKLLVRDYNLSASGKVIIYLDSFVDHYSKKYLFDQDEKIVEIAGTLIEFYLKNNFESTLTYLDKDSKKMVSGKKISQLDNFLKYLIGFAPNGKIDMTDFLRNDISKLGYGSTIIIILPKMQRSIIQLCNKLIRKKYIVFIIVLESDEYFNEYLESSKINYKIIGLDDDIPMKLEGRI